MSNYNNRNYNNKSRSAENSDGGKWLAVICGFAVVFLALIYIIVSNIIGVWNPVAWVNRKKSADDAANADKQPVAVDDKGNPYYSGVMYTLPKGLTFLNTLDEGAAPAKYSLADDEGETIIKGGESELYVTLRATVLPENADDKSVTWECSAPESIKIRYIAASGSMSETPEAGSTNNYIYVGLIDNLYETVTITCRSVSNPDIYSTCTIDQVVPLESLTYTAALTGGTTELVFGEEYTAAVTFEKKPGAIGTVIGTIKNPYWRIEIDSALYLTIQQYLQKSGFTASDDYGDLYFETNSGESTRALYASPYETFASASDAGAYNDASPDAFNNAFKLGVRDCAASGQKQATLWVGAVYGYKGYNVSNSRLETSSACTFDVSNIWIDVTQITIDKDNIVFIPN